MNYTTTWTFNVTDNITEPVRKAQERVEQATEKVRKFGDCLKVIRAIDWQAASQGLNSFLGIFSNTAQVGEDYQRALLDVSAITGVTGEDLDRLGGKARSLAKEFGGSATDNLGTFQTILSRLGPQIGNSERAMERMGKYANTLAKTMGGDVVGATDALTTSMLQFKVDLNDPIAAASEMERMMNVMAAGAKEGAAEVPQIAQALVQAGGAAKLSNVSFEETNAALQSLAQSGKYGAEAGVGLRNVLIKMNAPSALSKEATTMLAQYGVNMQKVSDTTVPFAERLKELQKVGQNTDVLAAVFGAENIQAAQGLINTADAQAELTQQITGTNVAVEQANTVMSGWGEKMSRVKAWFQDLQIAGFDVFKVLGAVGSGLGSTISVVGDLGAAYSGLGPVMRSFGTWISQTTLAQKAMAVWTKVVTAAQWLWNAALTANPIGIVIVAIGALVAGIVWLASKITGWGEAWKHTWEGAKLLFESWIATIKAHWNTLINGLMIGLNKIQEGWYKFKNATGLGDEEENNKMLAQIQADTEARKKAIVDGYKEAGEKAVQAKDEFVKAAGSLSWKKEEEKEGQTQSKTNTTLSPNAIIGGGDETWKGLGKGGSGDKGQGDKEKTMNVGGSGSGKTVNIKIEMKNYFTIDRSVGSKDVAANGVIAKLNDRMRDALVTASP